MRIILIFLTSTMLVALGACGRKGVDAVPTAAPVAQAAAPSTPIDSLSMSATLVGRPLDGDSSTIDRYVDAPAHTATVVTLTETNGQSFRLIDDVRSLPTISRTADGRYAVRFAYAAESGTEFAGRGVEELRTVTTLGVRWPAVIAALGMAPGSARLSHLTLSVNGRDLLSTDLNQPIADQGSDFQSIAVGSAFQRLPTG
ncbi:MAG TPA: hypothetical protein VII63_00085 [Caulobacteraceae bacterium]